MPAPEQLAAQQRHVTSAMNNLFSKASGDTLNLAFEVSELRKEIAALRAEHSPPRSMFVTGQQALDAFKNLKGTWDD